jgi:hypothetical protein
MKFCYHIVKLSSRQLLSVFQSHNLAHFFEYFLRGVNTVKKTPIALLITGLLFSSVGMSADKAPAPATAKQAPAKQALTASQKARLELAKKLADARKLMIDGKFADALPMYQDASKKAERFAYKMEALMGEATVYQALAKPAKENEVYKKIIALYNEKPGKGIDKPQRATILTWQSEVLTELNKPEELKKLFETAIPEYFNTIEPITIRSLREIAEENLKYTQKDLEGIDKRLKDAYLANDERAFFMLMRSKQDAPERVKKAEATIAYLKELEKTDPVEIKQPPQIPSFSFTRGEPKVQTVAIKLMKAYVNYLKQYEPKKAKSVIESLKLSFSRNKKDQSPELPGAMQQMMGLGGFGGGIPQTPDEVYQVVDEITQ